uniref:ATP synthase complex subunit 8 n=1 Tax=Potamanthellus edmundsi TaxID=2680887 RepID=A0A8K1VCD1_9INSE|nr:ATP synthase F0 subunit 8 [Potamanthellus edmundsi]
MPQMAPLSWIGLFFMFTFTFILFNILNYFCFQSSPEKTTSMNKDKTSSNSFNWSW